MKKIKVSYIVALYNKEKYITECIESILSENSSEILIEVCIVDDGSSDKSLSIVREKYSHNDNIKIFSFNYNKGKTAAYNKAFEISSGDYICIFGADDIVIPSRTQKMLQLSLSTNKSIFGNLIAFNESVDNINLNRRPLKTNKPEFYKNIMGNMIAGGTMLLIRSHANKIFPIPEHLKFEDWWISYHLLKYNWVAQLKDSVTLYRIHDSNDCASSTEDTYNKIQKDYIRHADYLDEFENIADTKEELKFINKSRLLREAFLGEYSIKDMKYLSIDKYSLKTLSYILLGSYRTHFLIDYYASLAKTMKYTSD